MYKKKRNNKYPLFIACVCIVLLFISFYTLPTFFRSHYKKLAGETAKTATLAPVSSTDISASSSLSLENLSDVMHVDIPKAVKSLYMTSWVAGTPSLRDHVIHLLDTTEANAVVVDIKDYTGKISFTTGNPEIDNAGCTDRRIADIKGLIKILHDKGVYVIGRVAVFQDPCFVAHHPEVAVKRKSDGQVWKDKKGIAWVDMGSHEAWEYAVKVAKTAYSLGFDEVNFDYVRFPSDGDMKNISFVSGATAKSEVFKEFFQYLDKELRGGQATSTRETIVTEKPTTKIVTTKNSKGKNVSTTVSSTSTVTTTHLKATDPAFANLHGRLVTSADLFGMVTTVTDDMGIGQVLENALPYIDFVLPMVYPSHFPATWNGFAKPATKPYEVIKISMGKAVERAKAEGVDPLKLRPWIQDFDLGAIYTADMVRAQMKATYDVGLTSWMVWDASNKYTAGAFLPN